MVAAVLLRSVRLQDEPQELTQHPSIQTSRKQLDPEAHVRALRKSFLHKGMVTFLTTVANAK